MIETDRLLLRPWTDADKPRFREIVNTPAMMTHLGGPTTDAALDALIDEQIALQARDGHSMWAVDSREDGALIGICGVRHSARYADTPVGDDLEIGWRIAEPLWGRGLAREAAAASIAWSWANAGFARLSAWTTIGNTRSWGLMERLGMARRADLDFRHPRFSDNADPNGAMIVYSLERPGA